MRNKIAILVALYVGCACAYSTSWWKQMASYLGDASFGYYNQEQTTNYVVRGVILPSGEHEALTLTGWYASSWTGAHDIVVQPELFYTPEEVQYSNPDLLGGAWAHGVSGGTNLVTAFNFVGFPFSTYTNHPSVTNTWKWGVYTVDGWSTNAVTLNLGGIDFTLGPGTFNRNVIAGGSGACILTGTGLVSIGISKTPCHRFYSSTMNRGFASTTDFQGIARSNGLAFVIMRMRSDLTNHIFDVSLRTTNATWVTYSGTNACTSRFSSGGIYQLWMVGPQNRPDKQERVFDWRVLPWRLSDEECDRIWQNSYDEVQRRGL
jgi:hypothetical protein